MNDQATPDFSPTSDERSLALWAHLIPVLALFISAGGLSFVGPLVIYFVKRDESAYVRDQAAEALNFQISLWLFLIVYSAISGILVCLGIGILMLIAVPLLLILPTLLFGILATLAVNRGETYRYPLVLRLVS